jgi:G3E family GTPase
MSDGRITVDVVTGFLGAGKTSLLRRLLRQPQLAGAAVLVNEFGEVGLDHLLLERVDGDVVLLKSGCVCCTVRGDLKDAIIRLLGRRASGEIPAFDRIAIETTGLADPTPVVATIVSDPALRSRLAMGATLAVVDGLNGFATLDAHDVSLRQAAAADRIAITKVDLAEPAEIAALEARLRALNPAAALLRLDEQADPPPLWLDRTADAPPARWLADSPMGEAGHGAGAFLLEADRPLDWARFGLWLSMLLNRHGDDILRLKGLVEIEGVAAPVAVQGVQRVVHAPEHLDRWPDGRRGTRLVVIARRIDRDRVRRSFRAFNGLATSDAPRKPVGAVLA